MKKRKKAGRFIAFVLFGLMFWTFPVHAGELSDSGVTETGVEGIWGDYGMDEVTLYLEQMMPEYEFDAKELLQQIIQGNLWEALKMVGTGVKDRLLAELSGVRQIFASVLILGIISALFSNFSDVFKNHQISDVSFYFLYLILMAVLMKVFVTAADIAYETIANIVLFIKMFIPAYFMAVGAATGTATAVAYYQLMLLLTYGVEKILLVVLLPLIYSYVLLTLINGIWIEERLTLILDFLKKGIVFSLKVLLGAVTGLSLFQSMITPVIDSLKTSAVKKAVSAIPGIGNLAEGVTEMVIGSAVLIKNSIGIFMLLLLLAICFVPLIKILMIACMIKGSAAMIGMVSDKRITGCTDRVGDGSLLLLRTTFTAVALFIITIAVVAYTTGKGI